MQFLRELWFVLVNVPELAHRYQNHSVFASIFLAVGVITRLVKNQFFADASMQQTLLKWISISGFCLTGLAFLLAFVDLVEHRLSFDDLVCTDVSVDAYYYPPEGKLYELVKREKCRNRTESSIRNHATLRDGYYEHVPEWHVQSKLLEGPSVQFIIQPISLGQRKDNNFPGSSKVIYLYQASGDFKPPLPSGTGYDLVYRISASGAPVEESAFSEDGTVFALGVDYDALKYTVAIHAPVGYKIHLWEHGVLDANGRLKQDETSRQEEPKVSPSGSLLVWTITLARKQLRYMLKYRFETYDWK